MTIAEHVRNAVRQLQQGEKIGRCGTPVIIFCPMRQKWEKYGEAWETLCTDGDDLNEAGMFVVPAVIQLAYFRIGEQVCQLAYVIQSEVKAPIGSSAVDMQHREYLRARGVMPRPL